MASVSELLVSIGVDASALESGISDAASAVDTNMLMVGGALAGAGAAAEGFARSQQDTTETLNRAAQATDMSADAARELAVAHSDGKTSAADNAAAMLELSQAGFKTRAELDQMLPSVDNLATAMGMDGAAAGQLLGKSMNAFGMEASEAGQAADLLTFATNNLGIEASTLERQLGKTGPELQAMGMSMDDTVNILGDLVQAGMSGDEALRFLGTAVRGADGDVNALSEVLGGAGVDLDNLGDHAQMAAGGAQELADANREAVTPLQQLQQHAENLMVKYGALGEVAGMLAMPMMAMGAILPMLATGFKALAAAKWSANLAFLASPITWIIIAVIALIAAIVLLIMHWDTVKEVVGAVWDWIVDKVSAALAWLVNLFGTGMSAVSGVVQTAMDFVRNIFATALTWITNLLTSALDFLLGLFMRWHPVGIVISHWDQISAVFRSGLNFVLSLVSSILAAVVGLFTARIRATGAAVSTGVANIRSLFNRIGQIPAMIGRFMSQMVSRMRSGASSAVGVVRTIPSRVRAMLSNAGSLLLGAGSNIVRGLINGIRRMLGRLRSTMSSVARTVRSFLPFSPAEQGPMSGSGAPEVSGARIATNLAAGMMSELAAVDAAADALMSPFDRDVESRINASFPDHINTRISSTAVREDRLVVEFDARGGESEFVKFMRKTVRVRGGDVQTVHGQGG